MTDFKGYQFFIDMKFEKVESQVGVFKCEYTSEMFYIQISDTIQISYINLLQERKDIRYYCEDIMEQVVRNEK
jgi:hypothetical protein